MRRGLHIPYLRTLVRDGAYAEGVVGVWPTVTYPSHTTLLTGVSPAEHGIYNNQEFDPGRNFSGAWYWYAPQDSRSHALAGSAQRGSAHGQRRLAGERRRDGCGLADSGVLAQLRPVGRLESVGSRADGRALASRTLLKQLQPSLGPYMMGNDTSIDGDEVKTRYSVEILRQYEARVHDHPSELAR